MSTFNSPVDVAAATLVRSSSINDLDAATTAAFALLPDETRLSRGTVNYAVDTGAANAYVVALAQVPTSYADGLLIEFKALASNTGASTVNVNALGVTSLTRQYGGVLLAGDIAANKIISARYNSTSATFEIQQVVASEVAAAATANAAAVTATNAASSATASAGIATTKAAEAAASAASIAGGPVTSVNGLTGIVVLNLLQNGGFTESNSALDLTLTATSNRVQAVSITVANRGLILPSATTLPLSGALYVVKNTGAIKFPVRNAAGVVLAVLAAGQVAAFYLTNNAAAAGVWAVGNQSAAFFDSFFVGVVTTANAVSSDWLSVTELSATQVLACYSGTSTFLQAVVLTISGSDITAGAVLTVNALASTRTAVVKLSATQAVVVYKDTSTFLQARTLNVSGTTVTTGALLTVNAADTFAISIARLSATQAITLYVGTTGFTESCTLNVSGTTVSAGAVVTVSTVGSNFTAICALSATQAVAAYQAATVVEYRVLTISGTTVTVGTATSDTASSSIRLGTISATQSLAVNNTSNNLRARVLTVSAGVVSLGANTAIATSSGGAHAVAELSATQAVVTLQGTGTNFVNAYPLTISSTTIAVGNGTVSNSAGSSNSNVVPLTATQALSAYQGLSGFLQASTLEASL